MQTIIKTKKIKKKENDSMTGENNTNLDAVGKDLSVKVT